MTVKSIYLQAKMWQRLEAVRAIFAVLRGYNEGKSESRQCFSLLTKNYNGNTSCIEFNITHILKSIYFDYS